VPGPLRFRKRKAIPVPAKSASITKGQILMHAKCP
jgi:hypothetical protein